MESADDHKEDVEGVHTIMVQVGMEEIVPKRKGMDAGWAWRTEKNVRH
jgi:hypothetical protein